MRAPMRLSMALLAAAIATTCAAPLARGSDTPSSSTSLADGGPGAAPAVVGAAPAPVTPTVRRYPVRGVSDRGVAVLPRSQRPTAADYAAITAPTPVTGVGVIGVTWSGPAPRGLAIEARTLTAGSWSGWRELHVEDEHGPTPGSSEAARSVPGTDPFVTGVVDDVQVRVSSRDGSTPRAMALSVIDPGASAADAPAVIAAEGAATAATPAALAGATPMPVIHTRGEWGADEGLRGCCVEYGQVHAGFVHHTVNANGYTRREVPAILRGIFAYHTQSRGWRDIGYNFLIDKFGRIWEGRYGGITLPVVGAHTLGYNENSFAASAIGNFQHAKPSAAMLRAYQRLYAWKLSLHGVRPTSRQNVAGTTFDAISGHRDAAATACPGIRLYRRIPDIIEGAAALQGRFGPRAAGHALTRDTVPDLLLARPGQGRLSVALGTGGPGFGARQVVRADLAGRSQVAAVGDVTGDGLRDLMVRVDAGGGTEVYRGDGQGGFTPTGSGVRKLAGSDLFAGPGDLDEDGRSDLVARDEATGALLVYRGLAGGGFGAGTAVIAKAGGLTALSAAGDFTGDGHVDVLARTGSGALTVFAGDGAGAFPTRVTVLRAGQGVDHVTGGADLTGDGRPDVVVRSADTGKLQILANLRGGGLSKPIAEAATPLASMALSRDVTGDTVPDLVTLTRPGALATLPARRQNWLTPPRERSASWGPVGRLLVVGDWDGDGDVDAMTREAGTGRMWLHPGRPGGGFDPRVGGWRGWSRLALLAAPGDVDGDGRPDLLATQPSGRLLLYPGRGLKGFAKPIAMGVDLDGVNAVVGAGLWDGDGAPDILARTRQGRVLLYRGNGPGGFSDPVVVYRRADRFDAFVSVGDLTGDGQADVVGREPGGDLYLLPGVAPSRAHPGGRLGAPRFVASGFEGYRLG